MSPPKKPRLISKMEVIERVPLSYGTILTMMQKGLFPRSREAAGRTVWVENEIDEWILSRPIRRLKGDPV